MNVSTQWLGFIAITLSALAYLPQVVRLARRHCATGLSVGANGMWLALSTLLLAYSIDKSDPVFLILQIYQTAAVALVLYFAWKYKDC